MNREIKRPTQSEDAEDLFPYLPSEIMLNILWRIPARTVMNCKRVCKAWRDLLKSNEFVHSHLSKSVPGLAVYFRRMKQYRIVEFVNEHRLNIVFSFDLPFVRGDYLMHSSANGLLLVCNQFDYSSNLFVCNPMTREYITLPSALEPSSEFYYNNIYGFGVTKMSGEYKVVRMSAVADDCQVYTVGSGSWRRIASKWNMRPRIRIGMFGATFLNGNLHWSGHSLICCLDLETEGISTFSPPPADDSYKNKRVLSVLGDYLCVCYMELYAIVRGIDIWLMKEYGDDKSWTKEFHFDTFCGVACYCPIKVFKGGGVLVEYGCKLLLHYSKRRGRVRKVDVFNSDSSCATIYAPSFLPLKTFVMENVSSF